MMFFITTIFWIAHLAMLLAVASYSKNKEFDSKVIATLYIFYSICPLFPFEYYHFTYHVKYGVEATPLAMYLLTDCVFLFCFISASSTRWIETTKLCDKFRKDSIGIRILLCFAMAAFVIHLITNSQVMLLSKAEYIASEKTPNLFFLNMPAEILLLGGLFFNPFKNKLLRMTLVLLAVFALITMLFQGYRHLLLFSLLCWLFRSRPKRGVTIPVIVLSVIGELSNPLKYFFASLLSRGEISYADFWNYYLGGQVQLIGISSEQKAIFSNLIIGLDHFSIFSPLLELQNLIPFVNTIFGHSQFSSANKIGIIAGTGAGQGTAYNFVLFLFESFFIGAIFLTISLFIVKVFSNSPLVFLAIELFFSIMRNTPEYWAGQLKMIAAIGVLVYLLNKASDYFAFAHSVRVESVALLSGDD